MTTSLPVNPLPPVQRMKPWRSEQFAIARYLHGQRRPNQTCDLPLGRWRIFARRRLRFQSLAWLREIEEAHPGHPCAVVVHATGRDRWAVILSLDLLRDLLTRLGDL